MSDDPEAEDRDEIDNSITTGNVSGIGIAIGHGATSNVTINKFDGPPSLAPEEAARLLAAYRARMLEDTRYVNLRGIPLPRGRDGRPMPLQVLLDKVYIRIQATTEKQRRVQEETEERSLLDRLKGESKSQPAPKDILSTLHTLGEYFYRRGEVYEAAQRPEPVDPDEALKKHKRLVVLGAPGAGKSTLLRYLTRRAAESSEGFVPVPVSLRDYATALAWDSTLALSEFALRAAGAGDTALRQALEGEIKNGHILWLVDALDEARGWAANAARQAGQLPGQLILTSRPIGYVGTGLESLPHFEVLPLMPENVDEFLHSWFGLLAAQRMANDEWITARVVWLKKQLEARPRIRALTRNPLLLTFLVVLAGEESLQDLPEQRAEIYRRYIEELLDSWETERRPRGGAEGQPLFTLGALQGQRARQVALQGFYYLGWALHLAYYGGKPQEPPTRDTLIKTLADYLQADGEKDVRSLAVAILEFWQEAGLLETWRLDGDDYLAFRHLTFQEYAAAWGIAAAWKRDSKRVWKFLRPRLHHYAWHEPMLLLVGLMDQTHLNDLAYRLLRGPSPYESSLHRDLFLSAELLAEGAAFDVRPRIFHKLDWLRRHHIWKRTFAILFVFLSGMFFLNLSGASWCLILPLFSIIFFWSAFADDSIPLVWRICSYPTRIWGFMPDRTNALRCLGQIGDAKAVPSLIQALQDGNGSESREAAELLGQIGSSAIPALTQALQQGEYSVRKAAVIEAFEQIGSSAIPALTQALQDGNEYVRSDAAKALGNIGDAQAVPALIQDLQDKRGQFGYGVPSDIIKALGKIGDAQAVPALIQALQDGDEYEQRDAAEALGKIGDAQAIPALTQALQHKKEHVCCYAAEALGKIGDAQAIPALIQALQGKEGQVRHEATKALGKIGGAQAIPALIQALQDGNEYEQRDAAEALGKIRVRDAQDIPALIQALQDRDKYVRCSASNTLGQIGDVRTVPALVRALQDRDKDVRGSAIESLGQIGDTQAMPSLIRASWDKNWNVRRNAAESLGKCANKLNDIKTSKRAARMLWWCLTDILEADKAFRSLEQIANRLSVLEIEAMPLVDPLLPEPTKKR